MRLGPVDQALVLLAEQLKRLERAQPRGNASAATRAASADPLSRVRQLAARGGLADEELERALVMSLIAGRFGERRMNGVRFQAVARLVTEILRADPATRELMGQAVERLRGTRDASL